MRCPGVAKFMQAAGFAKRLSKNRVFNKQVTLLMLRFLGTVPPLPPSPPLFLGPTLRLTMCCALCWARKRQRPAARPRACGILCPCAHRKPLRMQTSEEHTVKPVCKRQALLQFAWLGRQSALKRKGFVLRAVMHTDKGGSCSCSSFWLLMKVGHCRVHRLSHEH